MITILTMSGHPWDYVAFSHVLCKKNQVVSDDLLQNY